MARWEKSFHTTSKKGGPRHALAIVLFLYGVLTQPFLPEVLSAPIPPPRPAPNPSIVGTWKMFWNDVEWLATLSPDGRYVARHMNGICYEGNWALKGGVLTIAERRLTFEGPGDTFTYTFTMEERHVSRCKMLRFERLRH